MRRRGDWISDGGAIDGRGHGACCGRVACGFVVNERLEILGDDGVGDYGDHQGIE